MTQAYENIWGTLNYVLILPIQILAVYFEL